MSKELIDRLKSYIPSGDGHNSQYANDLADAVAILEAKAAPVAYITGQFAGRCVIEAINRAAVLPTGMALYATPQPSAGVVMPDDMRELLEEIVDIHRRRGVVLTIHIEQIADILARLNGKEVGRG